MKTILDYVKEYGKYTLVEKEFNEVDNVILSLLSYIDFYNIVPMHGEGSILLKDASKMFFKKFSPKEINRNILSIREAIILLKEIAISNRFKNLELLNYEYIQSSTIQFGALCIKLPNRMMYVSFEGTDSYVSGWEEDFILSYKFPVPAQIEAINYLNKVVKKGFFAPKVYVGGHSKGGNLALVSSMYCNYLVYRKIKKVYSNDGPGLRKRELESIEYKRVSSKFVHIVPNESVIGMLFRSEDNYTVVKSKKKKYFQHDALNWCCEDDHFVKTELSDYSKTFHSAMLRWLDKLDDTKREEFVKVFFSILKNARIEDLNQIREAKILNMLKILKQMKNISKENRTLLTSTIMGLYREWKG